MPTGLLRCPWPKEDNRSTSPITTTNGACRNTTTARFTKSWCSTDSRPDCRGSRFCASATISAKPSTISSRRRSRATRRRKVAALMQDAGIVRNRSKIEGAIAVRARLARDQGKRRRLLEPALGPSRRPAEGQHVQDHEIRAGRDAAVESDLEGPRPRAASSSSARPSSTPSCRRSAWSTIIW